MVRLEQNKNHRCVLQRGFSSLVPLLAPSLLLCVMQWLAQL